MNKFSGLTLCFKAISTEALTINRFGCKLIKRGGFSEEAILREVAPLRSSFKEKPWKKFISTNLVSSRKKFWQGASLGKRFSTSLSRRATWEAPDQAMPP